MPNFLRSIFSSTPKQVSFVAGEKAVRAKTVEQVLGESFDYLGSIRANSVFCKKMLKFCASEFSTENMLFVLVCEKYSKAPTSGQFNLIYDDFIQPGADRQINLPGSTQLALTTIWKVGDPGSSSVVFNDAVKEIKALIQRDSVFRLKQTPFDTAFTLRPEQTRAFDAAIAYLKTHQITLL